MSEDDLGAFISARIPMKMKRRLKELARSRSKDESELIRDAVAQYLNNLHPIKIDEFTEAPQEKQVSSSPPQVRKVIDESDYEWFAKTRGWGREKTRTYLLSLSHSGD
jgi:predicted DNA-binding protein